MGTKAYENPLLSNKRLREMYTAMVESRALGETMRRGKLRGFAPGTEACWVGSAIGLRDVDGDFASAGAVGATLDLVMGVAARSALKGIRSPGRLAGDDARPAGTRLVCPGRRLAHDRDENRRAGLRRRQETSPRRSGSRSSPRPSKWNCRWSSSPSPPKPMSPASRSLRQSGVCRESRWTPAIRSPCTASRRSPSAVRELVAARP